MNLKGVILAGGSGSRLRPLTKVTNKHLLPVGQKPMIYYPIEKLTSVGIKQILIVTGVEYMGDVVGLLGSGREFGCQFTYRVQDETGGIAQALGLAENFAQHMAVILGDNIFHASLKSYADKFISKKPVQGYCSSKSHIPSVLVSLKYLVTRLLVSKKSQRNQNQIMP